MDRVTQFSKPRPITAEELESFEWEFGQLMLLPADAERVWRELFGFFYPYNEETVRKYYDTYWRWFVALTWEHAEQLIPSDQFATVLMTQLPMVCLLRNDIESLIFYYLYRVYTDPNDQRGAFLKIREELLKSNISIDPLSDGAPTLSSVAEKMRQLNVNDDTVLEKSEIYTDVKKTGYESEEYLNKLHIVGHSFDSATNLLRLIIFFSEERDITQILYDYFDAVHLDAELYGEEVIQSSETTEPEQPAPPSSQTSKKEANQKPPEQPKPVAPSAPKEESQVAPPAKESPKKQPPSTPSPAPTQKREQRTPSYNTIRKQIESEFLFGTDGQPEDVEGVIARLDELAKKYGDERITELFYFNENSGRFEWSST